MTVAEDSPYHIKWCDVDKLLNETAFDEDEKYGCRLKLDTPSIPSMDLYMERFESTKNTKAIKSTANHIFVCAEGTGSTEVEGDSFSWERGDVVAVPSWKSFRHSISNAATLLEITDQPLIEMLGWYREIDQKSDD